MNKWLWLILIPSLVFAGSPAYNMRKDPIYLDVHPDKFIAIADKVEILESELAVPDNKFDMFMEQAALQREQRYLVLLLRPGSEHLRKQLQQIIQKYDVDVGVDVWEEDREFSIKENMQLYAYGTSDIPEPDPFLKTLKPYVVELQEDKLILPDSNIVVTREELRIPGNPFEELVDRFEANGGNPYIVFRPVSNPMHWEAVEILELRAPLMCSNYFAANTTILVGTPLEAQTDGMEPVYFECRNNQLFPISAERPQEDAPNIIGYDFDDPKLETTNKWFGSRVAKLDPATQYICFLIRPSGFDIFRRARKVVWDQQISSTCELLDETATLTIDFNGPALP